MVYLFCPEGNTMESEKITIRLPMHLIHAVDTFIRIGELSTRTEAIRRALQQFVEDMAKDLDKKTEMWKQIRELESVTEEVERLRKK